MSQMGWIPCSHFFIWKLESNCEKDDQSWYQKFSTEINFLVFEFYWIMKNLQINNMKLKTKKHIELLSLTQPTFTLQNVYKNTRILLMHVT